MRLFQDYVRPEILAAANAPLVARQACRSPRRGGGGLVAAADGMRVRGPGPGRVRPPDRKYFGSRRGMAWLNLYTSAGWAAAPRRSPP